LGRGLHGPDEIGRPEPAPVSPTGHDGSPSHFPINRTRLETQCRCQIIDRQRSPFHGLRIPRPTNESILPTEDIRSDAPPEGLSSPSPLHDVHRTDPLSTDRQKPRRIPSDHDRRIDGPVRQPAPPGPPSTIGGRKQLSQDQGL